MTIKNKSDDKALAAKMVEEDFRESLKSMRAMGARQDVAYCEGGAPPADLPPGDGEGLFIPFVLGSRGKLTKQEARAGARMWREASARYPKAHFHLVLLGEVWEFSDVTRYVRWWARFAGLDDLDTALRFFGPSSPTGQPDPIALFFLGACGVFGEGFKQQVLATANMKPTPKH